MAAPSSTTYSSCSRNHRYRTINVLFRYLWQEPWSDHTSDISSDACKEINFCNLGEDILNQTVLVSMLLGICTWKLPSLNFWLFLYVFLEVQLCSLCEIGSTLHSWCGQRHGTNQPVLLRSLSIIKGSLAWNAHRCAAALVAAQLTCTGTEGCSSSLETWADHI